MNQTEWNPPISQFTGKNPPPQNGCRLKSVFFKSTGFTSSTFLIQPDFSQNQLAAITLNTGSPQTLRWNHRHLKPRNNREQSSLRTCFHHGKGAPIRVSGRDREFNTFVLEIHTSSQTDTRSKWVVATCDIYIYNFSLLYIFYEIREPQVHPVNSIQHSQVVGMDQLDNSSKVIIII
jgi:hypothetical protein